MRPLVVISDYVKTRKSKRGSDRRLLPTKVRGVLKFPFKFHLSVNTLSRPPRRDIPENLVSRWALVRGFSNSALKFCCFVSRWPLGSRRIDMKCERDGNARCGRRSISTVMEVTRKRISILLFFIKSKNIYPNQFKTNTPLNKQVETIHNVYHLFRQTYFQFTSSFLSHERVGY